jgi:subtilisin family serine protease
MVTKRVILGVVFVFVALSGVAQNKNVSQRVERIEGVLYLIENDEKFKVDTEVITVRLKSSEKKLGSDIRVIRSNRLGFVDIQVPDSVDVEEYVNNLKKTGKFENVEYCCEAKCCLTPNDVGKNNQWHINHINLYSAWNITTGASNIKVAIIDTGVEGSHSDLGYTVSDGYTQIDTSNGVNYTTVPNAHISPIYFHGTFVAGILGAKTNNTTGIAGVSGGNHSKGVTIIPYCVGNSLYFTTNSVDDAILDAVDKGVKVINISFYTPYSTSLDLAIEDAYANNVTIVCSSGNDNSSAIGFPASHTKTIAVGAINQNNFRADFSNYGSGLDIVAPGKDIYSTSLNNSYYTSSGTSFAAPQVAGVAALMLSVNPTLTPSQIRSKLRSSCTKLPGYSYNSGWNNEVGYGLLNAYGAVCAALSGDNIVGPQLVSISAQYDIANFPNISGLTVSWSLSDNYYNTGYNLLIQNYPSMGHCVIVRDPNHDMMDATLTAQIKYNGVTVQSLPKSGIHAYSGFKGQYTSGSLSGDIHYSLYFNIKANTTTTVTSANFYGATVTYSSSGAIPTAWGFNSTNGVLNFKAPAGSAPVIINVHDVCGNNYVLYAMPSSSYSINVSNGDSGITVTLVEEGDAARGLTEPWTLEVINAETGRVMATQSSMNRSETISTAGWPKGIYIVKVTIGKEELTEKVMVK